MDITKRATAVGLAAPMLWAMNVGLTRSIAEDFGVAAGFSILYGLAFIFLLAFFGLPKFNKFSLKYLIFGVGSASATALCFVTSLALADGAEQAMQIGMVNYLWPCLTIIFGILFNGQRAHWWLGFGFMLSLMGIGMVLTGGRGLDLPAMAANVQSNPWSYLLALTGALLWSGYCSMTRAWSKGQNPVVLIFAVNALIFTGLWLSGAGPQAPAFSWTGLGTVFVGAFVTSAGYACWTHGMMKGNMTLLAIASYSTPVLSCLFVSLLMGAALTWGFAKGIALLVIGSLVCYMATRVDNKPAARPMRVLFSGRGLRTKGLHRQLWPAMRRRPAVEEQPQPAQRAA